MKYKREDVRSDILPFFTQHKKQINLSLLGTIATVYNPPMERGRQFYITVDAMDGANDIRPFRSQ